MLAAQGRAQVAGFIHLPRGGDGDPGAAAQLATVVQIAVEEAVAVP
jgi:hypothetical protein